MDPDGISEAEPTITWYRHTDFNGSLINSEYYTDTNYMGSYYPISEKQSTEQFGYTISHDDQFHYISAEVSFTDDLGNLEKSTTISQCST